MSPAAFELATFRTALKAYRKTARPTDWDIEVQNVCFNLLHIYNVKWMKLTHLWQYMYKIN